MTPLYTSDIKESYSGILCTSRTYQYRSEPVSVRDSIKIPHFPPSFTRYCKGSEEDSGEPLFSTRTGLLMGHQKFQEERVISLDLQERHDRKLQWLIQDFVLRGVNPQNTSHDRNY